MTLLVLGSGAEDVEDPLGRAVLDLAGTGAEVVGTEVADDARLSGGVADVLSWAVTALGVTEVLLALPDAAHVEVPPGPTVTRLERPELLAVLAWRRSAPPPRAPRRDVRDRSPRVSVLVPVHRHEAFLDAALRSCLDQTYDDHEVVVLDDGSTDASPSVLERYAGHPRVRVITQPNIGWTGELDLPFNRLVREARGELHAWMGGDDVSLPHRLAAQVEAFDDDPGLDVCHGAAEAIDEHGSSLGTVWHLARAYDELSMLRDLLVGNLVGHPSVMLRAGAHDRVGLFEQGLVCDYHLWLKAAGRLRFRYLPRLLVRYRQHDRALSTSAEGFIRSEREAVRVRGAVLSRRSLDDLFPELVGAGPRARQEAAIALGNQLLGVDADLALRLYDLAEDCRPGPDVDHGRALAHLAAGDVDAAVAAADAAAAAAPTSRPLARALRVGHRAGPVVREPRGHLDPALAAGRARASAARCWDGSPIGVRSAYVAVDPERGDLAGVALAHWAATTAPASALRWVLPDLGQGQERVLAQVVGASAGLDLSGAADLLIDVVDDLSLLPPDPARPTGVLRTAHDVDAVRRWASASGASARG